MLLGHTEQLPDHLRSVAEVLLDELRADNAQEGGRGLVGDRLGQESLAGTRTTVQNHACKMWKILILDNFSKTHVKRQRYTHMNKVLY